MYNLHFGMYNIFLHDFLSNLSTFTMQYYLEIIYEWSETTYTWTKSKNTEGGYLFFIVSGIQRSSLYKMSLKFPSLSGHLSILLSS